MKYDLGSSSTRISMVDRSPRVNIALSEAIFGKLERYAQSRGSKVSTEASYLLTRTLDDLDNQGRIPPPKDHDSLRSLVLEKWDVLCVVPQLADRLHEIRAGNPPTREEILEISIALDLSGKYVADLANKGKKNNGTTHAR